MKKILVMLLSASLLLALAACAPAPSPTATPSDAPTVGPTATPSPTPFPPTPTPTPAPSSGTYRLVDAYPALRFDQPLLFAVAGDGSQDAYVVERTGRIRIVEDRSDAPTSKVFLDLRGTVYDSGQEQGLLGLAFHPQYKTNGLFFVNYTTRDATVIARYRRSADDPRTADPASATVLLTFPQPYANHNGGHLAFGPDGFLYISTGDGGSAGDPQNRAQDRTTLLGKILRIDVDRSVGDTPYAIPADNPFAGNADGFREEIFAFGLRNPWRFSFDAQGALWAGDVGQNRIEEIDLVEPGGNYGWNVLEGTLDYKDLPGVDRSALIPPVWEYDHSQGESVTGGFVYAGSRMPHLKGTYVYGDYISGRLWTLWIDSEQKAHNALLMDTSLHVSSFGLDADGELRIVDLTGKIYRLTEDGG